MAPDRHSDTSRGKMSSLSVTLHFRAHCRKGAEKEIRIRQIWRNKNTRTLNAVQGKGMLNHVSNSHNRCYVVTCQYPVFLHSTFLSLSICRFQDALQEIRIIYQVYSWEQHIFLPCKPRVNLEASRRPVRPSGRRRLPIHNNGATVPPPINRSRCE